jgi:hypothetical protein
MKYRNLPFWFRILDIGLDVAILGIIAIIAAELIS